MGLLRGYSALTTENQLFSMVNALFGISSDQHILMMR
jgi:hypothetical protein